MLHNLLHIDQYLTSFVAHYGILSYALLFFIIFAETGLVIMPFLPGDSLLFASGLIAGQNTHILSAPLLVLLLTIAALLGCLLNYWIGDQVGHYLFVDDNALFFKKRYLNKTHDFYEKYGGKTLIIARFVPIVRTYAPFVAGIGSMSFRKFSFYNLIGAIAWVGLIVYLGFFFGNVDWIANNFSIALIILVVASISVPVLPTLYRSIRKRIGSTN